MSDIKKFFELVSQDKSVKAELQKAVSGAVEKVAEAHGFNLKMEEVSSEELSAVAGGNSKFGRDVCKYVTLWNFEN